LSGEGGRKRDSKKRREILACLYLYIWKKKREKKKGVGYQPSGWLPGKEKKKQKKGGKEANHSLY